MTVRELVLKSDTEECVDVLVKLHRQDFHAPGYILSGSETKKQYNSIINNILETEQTYTRNDNVNVVLKNNILNISINNKPFSDPSVDIQHVANAKINYPKHITKEGVLSEILYELFSQK